MKKTVHKVATYEFSSSVIKILVLSHFNSVHTLITHFLKSYFNTAITPLS